jgi:hypothetical protein
MSDFLLEEDQSSEGKTVVEVIDDYMLIRTLLRENRFNVPIHTIFYTIGGTRIWENKFYDTNLPLLITCKARDEAENLTHPDMMLLTKEHFDSCPVAKENVDGLPAREVSFKDLPIVSKKVLKDLNYVER